MPVDEVNVKLHYYVGGSGWPTSLRRRYTMLALPLSGFESRQQERKQGIGKTPAQNVPQ